MHLIRSSAATVASTIILAAGSLGSSVLAQSESDPGPVSPPVPFTAHLACGQYAGGEPEIKREVIGHPGSTATEIPRLIWRFRAIEASDPRMDGSVLGYLAGFDFGDASGFEDTAVYSALWQVVNEGGQWIGPYSTLVAPEFGYATNAIRLVGSGGYDGLFAVIQADFRDDCGWDVTGYILEQDVPGFPAPMAAVSP
jgi:hypothetical protein